MKAPLFLSLWLCCAPPAQAQASCSSDGTRAPTVLLERFISADCETCWRDPSTPKQPPGAVAIDWVVPGQRGEHAPLSVVATRDAVERLRSMLRDRPLTMEASSTRVEAGPERVRVAHGVAFNDYMAASIEVERPGAALAREAWLLLVEELPAGTEGSPVPRLLVRNLFRSTLVRSASGRMADSRAMRIPEGAKPERLRVVGWVQDARGPLKGIAMSRCRSPATKG